MEITAKHIFEIGRVLTLSVFGRLIGKTIACTNPEYEGNIPTVNEFTISGFISEWDHAATLAYPDQKGKYHQHENYQQYWASYMSTGRIKELKCTYMIVCDKAGIFYRCTTNNNCFMEPTFHGSDADREVYFIILNP